MQLIQPFQETVGTATQHAYQYSDRMAVKTAAQRMPAYFLVHGGGALWEEALPCWYTRFLSTDSNEL